MLTLKDGQIIKRGLWHELHVNHFKKQEELQTEHI